MIKGFSKLSKEEKIGLVSKYLTDRESIGIFKSIALKNKGIERLISELSENVLSIFPFPYSIAPNFLIDKKGYFVPMVTEESSVVAAAAKSAGYWHARGGFHTEIVGMVKTGQVHLRFNGSKEKINAFFAQVKRRLIEAVHDIDFKMIKRGGGIQNISLIDRTGDLKDYYQLNVRFNTCNAMGANYMNSCLEGIAVSFLHFARLPGAGLDGDLEVVMSILSNYSPESAVKVWAECPIPDLADDRLNIPAAEFARKFHDAVKIAEIDVNRAVTHNKGIYNGVDSVALATGNDWRAIEANGHAFASASGHYKSLSKVNLENNIFHFEVTLPLQVGTVGGATNLHPLAKLSLEVLQNPSSADLMKIMASVGLASHFAAIRSLITTGIQKGHMKMHLSNILLMLNASEAERIQAYKHFSENEISHAAVERFIKKLRGG